MKPFIKSGVQHIIRKNRNILIPHIHTNKLRRPPLLICTDSPDCGGCPPGLGKAIHLFDLNQEYTFQILIDNPEGIGHLNFHSWDRPPNKQDLIMEGIHFYKKVSKSGTYLKIAPSPEKQYFSVTQRNIYLVDNDNNNLFDSCCMELNEDVITIKGFY